MDVESIYDQSWGNGESGSADINDAKWGGEMYARPARPSLVSSPGSFSDCPTLAGAQALRGYSEEI